MTVTPYMNESGDWWIAVGDVPNRKEAAAVVKAHTYSGRIKYTGIETAWLRDGDFNDDSAPSRHVPAYHFLELEERF